jgi:TRAP-type uncharacterized transport system fused permease subunit
MVRHAVTAIAVLMVLYHMWAIAFGSPEAVWFRGTHLMFALVLLFLIYRSSGRAGRPADAVRLRAAGRSALPILLPVLNYEYVVTRIFYIDELTHRHAHGRADGVIVLEATRRVIGWTLPLTAMAFLIYGLCLRRAGADAFPRPALHDDRGHLRHPALGLGTYVLIFVLFGAFMERTGTGQLFMDFAMALTGHTAGGPGKVAVVSSSLFGSISGSAVANVMVTGQISIPLMKRTGFPRLRRRRRGGGFDRRPDHAADHGRRRLRDGRVHRRQLRPGHPVGADPGGALLRRLLRAVHFEAKRRGLVGVPRADLPSAVGRRAGRARPPVHPGAHHPVRPVFRLQRADGGADRHARLFPGGGCCASRRAATSPSRNIVDAMVDGARNTLSIALACACAGIVIAVVTLSGLGIDFTQFVVGLAQDTLLLALILTMIAGIVLGMGMPTTPAYIIMTALLVPAIIKLGVVVPAAHMFAFYFAIMSAITPPVALAVFAAAGIAKADIWASGWAAVKIGFAGFIIPFMFVYEPALLMIGDWTTILQAVVTASFGVAMFAGGLHGYFAGPAPQPPLVRRERPALLRPSLAHAADGLRPQRLRRQAGDRHHQHLERHQSLPHPLPRARRGRQARRLAGGRLPGRDAGDVARRAVPEAHDHALPQLPRDGDRGAAALLSGRRRGADGRLRQDHARADHGRAVSMNLPAIFVPAGPMLRGNWREVARLGSDTWKYWASCAPATSPSATGRRSRTASRARPAPA